MVNLTNFMDWIDGVTGVEMTFIGVGILVIAPQTLGLQSAALVGAALGFLLWNWAPAKVFLGDSGSLPLGLISGGLLIELGLEGAIAAALLIPGAYLFDATLTLMMRAWRREAIWRAHRSHAYQRHARALGSHAQAVNTLIIVNLMLLALAALSRNRAREGLALFLGLMILAAYYALVRRAEIRAKRNAST
jgi:UDP-N-acetylmuramyl pentapeptide phosphotransferase/UDP-N-acetylglucosamine-1-phosphate transferase